MSTDKERGWQAIDRRIQIEGALETQTLLEIMRSRGQSIVLTWGEDTRLWECSWITGGTRYTAIHEVLGVAVYQAHKGGRSAAGGC